MKFSHSSLKNLIVPVEIQIREFDAKLLLSCFAAEKGFKVFIGNTYEIRKAIDLLPPAIYLGKDFRSLSTYQANQNFSNPVVAWDEEGLVYYSPELYLKRRIVPETFNLLDGIFAWGPDNAALINSVNRQQVPIHVTGNPRGDLLRPEFSHFFENETEKLKNEYGDFILINTNFGMVNGIMKEFNQLPLPSEAPPPYGLARKLYNPDLAVHRHALFNHFLELLKFMAEHFPRYKIVLRPHPSESYGPWQEIAKLFPNIVVIRKGNVLPWLKACKLLIHNGCTTAVEGSLLGIEMIAYCPISSEGLDAQLPNNLSLQATNFSQLEALAVQLLEGNKLTNSDPRVREFRAIFRNDHMANVENSFASEKIVELLEILSKNIQKRHLSWNYIKAKIRAIKKRNKQRYQKDALMKEDQINNFPEISVQEVNRRIRLFSECLNGKFDHIKAEDSIKPGVFKLGAGID
jgi:surface carbohydrate biosynthesis protein